jgi:hypothetical protein
MLLTDHLPERLSELDNGWSMRTKAKPVGRQLRCNEGSEGTAVDWGCAWHSELPQAPGDGSPGVAALTAREESVR